MNKNKQVSHSRQETISIIFHAPIKRARVGYTVADCTVYKQYISQSSFLVLKINKANYISVLFLSNIAFKAFLTVQVNI